MPPIAVIPFTPGFATNGISPSPRALQAAVEPSTVVHNTPPTQAETRSPDLKRALGDQRNWQSLTQLLDQAAQGLAPEADAQAVASALAGVTFTPDVDSSYVQQQPSRDTTTVDLERFLIKSEVRLPRTRTELLDLAKAMTIQALQPPYGNYGGGLSWPLPLSVSQQQSVLTLFTTNSAGLSDLPLIDHRAGPLGYLADAVPLSGAELQDPGQALEKLIQSPRGQALGQAIQTHLNGVQTPSSTRDYVLTAINLGLDSESISHPQRNTVAGFDLAQEQHWGKSPSSIVNALRNHLVTTGKATMATAQLGAHLLLARLAPQFLVKDIPDKVTYGSQSWASFHLAVAKIEASTPGVTPQMSYAQVMSIADASDASVYDATQTAVLIDWAVANGVLDKKDDSLYSSAEIERARSDFNQQLDERATASSQLRTPIPDLKQIALAKLEQQFGKGIPFEEKCIKADYYFRSAKIHQGTYSMLDIAMMDHHDVPKWKTTDSRIPIDSLNAREKVNVFDSFKTAFDDTISIQKQGIKTAIKHMIAQLPLADRKNLESGEIHFYQERTYTIATDFFSPPALTSKSKKMLIKVGRDNPPIVYEVDLAKGAIARGKLSLTEFRNANRLHRTEEFNVGDAERPARLDATPGSALPPQSFSSVRTQDIADAFVEAFDLDNADVLKQARGVTTFDEEQASRDKVNELLLNLIPLRSAIVNFQQGNYADGVMDLGLDLLGFLTAGAATSARAGKVVSTATSSTAKALGLARAIGVSAIEALNPLSGVGDLLMGTARLAKTGAKGAAHKIQALRGSADSYDLVAASQKYDAAATGTFKYADQSGDTLAVQQQGKWYAYDEGTQQAYGSPLEDFTPLNTLMPVNRDWLTLHHPHSRRYNPLQRIWRKVYPAAPPPPPKALPSGDYALSMKGKWQGEHFSSQNALVDTALKFESDMHAYFNSANAGNIPPRPAIPSIPTPVPSSEVITKGLQASDGLVFGENHGERASFQLLYDNMDLFVRQKVKRVYIEGVADYPSGIRDDGIGWLGDTNQKRTQPNFEELKRKFEENGIEVLPLDHVYLTQRYNPTLSTKEYSVADAKERLERFNYYAAQTIKATSGGEKWIALVGRFHTNTQLGVPGMAELTGGLSIGIFPKKMTGPSDGLTNTFIVPPGHVPGPTTPMGDLTISFQVRHPQP